MRTKSDQVFQLSLTEIALILLFILMVLMGLMYVQATQEKDRLAEQLAALAHLTEEQARFAEARETFEVRLRELGVSDPDALISHLVEQSEAHVERDRLKLIVEDLEQKLSAMVEAEKLLAQAGGKTAEAEKAVEVAVMMLADLKRVIEKRQPVEGAEGVVSKLTADEARQAFEQLLAVEQTVHEARPPLAPEPAGLTPVDDVKVIADEARQWRESLAAGTNTIKLKRDNADLRGQIVFLQKKLDARGGMDFPPCWADEKTGKIQMLFSLVLHNDELRVTPAWPAERTEDAQALPGIRQALAQEMQGYERFLLAASGIVAQSRERQCRHYVRLESAIADAVVSDRRRLAIEGSFYKFEVRR